MRDENAVARGNPIRDGRARPLVGRCCRRARPRRAHRRSRRRAGALRPVDHPRDRAAAARRELPLDIRRELPAVLVRIGTAEAEQALIGSLLQADVTLRHRVIASLNKLRTLHPEVKLDPSTINLLLAAEIAGHYRSYQVLGPLGSVSKTTTRCCRPCSTRWIRSSIGSSG